MDAQLGHLRVDLATGRGVAVEREGRGLGLGGELATNDDVWFTGLPFELDLDEAVGGAHLDEGVELRRATQNLHARQIII